MYRPEGWPELLRKKAEEWNANPPEWTFDNFIEFGADAIIKALREDAFWIIDGSHKVEIDSTRCFANGRLVFIPDEEK